jgi:hypothetical protein
MTNNPSCIEPGNSLSTNPQLLLLSQVDQDEWPPLLSLTAEKKYLQMLPLFS